MNDMKKALLKGLVAIAAIIVIFTSLSKLLLGNSETLSEYAERNNLPTQTQTPAEKEPDNTAGTISGNDATDYVEADSDINASEDAYTGETASMEVTSIPIAEHFYYAPLTEEQKEYITGCSYPDTTEELAISYDDLVYLHLIHYNFEGYLAEGELICNIAIAEDLKDIFYELYLNEYRIERIELVEVYDGDDNKSMEANNTSCFNYREVEGSNTLSKHAYGLAIDINPFYNPYITYNDDMSNHVTPEGSEAYADRSADFPYKIDENDLCYKLFKEHGFTWGGDWNSCKDYQHFQKTLE